MQGRLVGSQWEVSVSPSLCIASLPGLSSWCDGGPGGCVAEEAAGAQARLHPALGACRDLIPLQHSLRENLCGRVAAHW